MINRKTKKVTSILITVLLTLSLYTYAAQAFPSDCTASLSSQNSGVSEYVDHSTLGSVIHLMAPGTATTVAAEGRIEILLPDGTTLGGITSIAWDVYTKVGYPPHVDLLLDYDDDGTKDDALTFEFAYQPYTGSGDYMYNTPSDPYGHYDPGKQSTYYDPTYNVWLSTLQQTATETGTEVIDDDSVAWLDSGLPGPYTDGYFGTLADFKAGTVQVLGGTTLADVDKDTIVLALHIEVDNWIGESEAYIDNVAVNGELLIEAVGPTVTIVDPEAKTYSPGDIPVEIEATDIFGVSSVEYNLKDEDDNWVYGTNKAYTAPTVMSGLSLGEYTLYAWAENNLGITTEATVDFKIARLDVAVEVHPETLNLKSGGNWITVKILLPSDVDPTEFDLKSVKLWIGGEWTSPEWGTAGDDCVMLKFSRSWVQGRVPLGDEVEITVTGDLPEGGSFKKTDTIRVINPGNGKMVTTQQGSGKGPKDKPDKNNNGNGPKNNNGNGPKNGKHNN